MKDAAASAVEKDSMAEARCAGAADTTVVGNRTVADLVEVDGGK
jgi:hypothetical protein